jgi:hypothetical protein
MKNQRNRQGNSGEEGNFQGNKKGFGGGNEYQFLPIGPLQEKDEFLAEPIAKEESEPDSHKNTNQALA